MACNVTKIKEPANAEAAERVTALAKRVGVPPRPSEASVVAVQGGTGEWYDWVDLVTKAIDYIDARTKGA